MNGASDIKKKIAESFSRQARTYDLKAKLQKEVAASLNQRVSPYLRGDQRFLDLGCGTGLVTKPLLEAGHRVHCLDIAFGMLSVLKEKTIGSDNLSLTVGDGEFLPYANDSFDIVVSSLTYHWIWNLKEALAEVFRVLREKGVFVCALLGEDSFKELRTVYAETGVGGSNGLPPLIRFPNQKEIEAALEKSDFKEVKTERQLIIKRYPNLWDLLKALKEIGAANPFKGKEKTLRAGATLRAMNRIYHQRFTEKGMIRSSFEIVFCAGRKV